MGMEHDPNIPGREPDLRASDAERAQIIELLRRHHQDGRLTGEELAERIERVNAATTFGDLDASMANLPRLLPPLAPPTVTVQERTPGAARQTFYRVLFAYMVINLFLIGIWAYSIPITIFMHFAQGGTRRELPYRLLTTFIVLVIATVIALPFIILL